MTTRGTFLILACTLAFSGCAGKDAASDSSSPPADGGGEAVVAPEPLDCSKSWAHCFQVGEDWPQSYPPMTADKAYQLALRWSMCAAVAPGGLPWLWECAMGTCLAYELPELDAPSMECILAASDCNEVRCCWGMDSGTGCDGTVAFEPGCDGTVATTAWPIVTEGEGTVVVRKWDCAWSHGNPQCFEWVDDGIEAEIEPVCGAGTCVEGTAASCDGDVLVLCHRGIERRVDCVERGRLCAPHVNDDGDVEAACVVATQCLLPHCEGNRAVYCTGGNEVMRIDCSWYGEGFACQEGEIRNGKWYGGCRNPAAECDPATAAQHCDGSVAHFCTDKGQWFTFDCADFANGRCVEIPDSEPQPDHPADPSATTVTPHCLEGP